MGGEQSSLPGLNLIRSASVGARQQQLRSRGQSDTAAPLDLASARKLQPAPKSSFTTPPRRATVVAAPSTQMMHSEMNAGTTSEEQHLELLDSLRVEWEGYVEKKGHLVRNWKTRYFTLEGNVLSYYESKEHARRRESLKGRVTLIEVHLDNRVKSAHGHDFVFETKEGKHFHMSAPTDLDRRVWVHMMEAGIDFESCKRSNSPIYGKHNFQKVLKVNAEKVYSLYRHVLTTEPEMIPEFLFYFSKDVVLSLFYPRKLPFHGDLFGREGLLYFLSTLRENFRMEEFSVSAIKVSDDGKKATIHGFEKLRAKTTSTGCDPSKLEILQPWIHHVEFGPYGRIVKLRIDIDPKQAIGNWHAFTELSNPYSEPSVHAFHTTRALSISLHDFTVFHVIGKGGFGTVVNAQKKSDGQIYALKILEKGKMTKYDIESSFTEMRVGQSIHHPFIAGLKIAFQSRTKLFLGMNYYSGGDLFHHMSKGTTCRITPSRARFYTAELILAIYHLHQHDILYRDLKPENVMIDHDGHIALVDFGLAKIHVSNYKGAKTMAGSPQYTAPELLQPKGKRSYGKAADWWSLGILLYEMSVGKSPFFNTNIEKMYRKIQTEELEFPLRPSISDELKDVLLGLMRKDPTKRLGNVITELLEHPFFRGLDWDLLLERKIAPPWKPKVTSELDVGYVDPEFTGLDASQEVSSPKMPSSSNEFSNHHQSSHHHSSSSSTSHRLYRNEKHNSTGFLSQMLSKSTKKKDVSSKPSRIDTSGAQDPVFKDFNYFCDDPEALVEVKTLRGELRPLSVKEEEKEEHQETIEAPSNLPSPLSSGHQSSSTPCPAGIPPATVVGGSSSSSNNGHSNGIGTRGPRQTDVPAPALASQMRLSSSPILTGTPLSSFVETGHLMAPPYETLDQSLDLPTIPTVNDLVDRLETLAPTAGPDEVQSHPEKQMFV